MSTQRISATAATAALALVLSACASGGVVVASDPPDRGPSTAATLGIPPGHLPQPGDCRVWVPGQPPGHQSPPGSCATLSSRVPAHGWLVYNPGGAHPGKGRGKGKGRAKGKRGRGHRGGGGEIRVTVYGEATPVVIRWFDQASGKLVREEQAID